MEDLIDTAKSLAGREVEVVPTQGGGFIVEWFNFNTPPPPEGSTKEEALERFISFIKENQDAVNDTGDEESREEIERSNSAQG